MGIVRKTKSVTTVKEIFQQNTVAIAAVELVSLLKTKMNKTTVYRILERLENEGVLHSFTDNDGLKWYASCVNCSTNHHQDVHPHFRCKKCSKVECLHIQISIPSTTKLRIDNSEIFLIGTCETCLSVG